MTAIQGSIQQIGPALGVDGNDVDVRMTRMQQVFTANWREELLMGGYCYSVSVGGISAGGDAALVTGGGAGTVIDSDQPEVIVSVPSGYYLIPLEFQASAQVDLDADAEVGNILLFADVTQAVAATGVTGTAGTAIPMLGGGPSSVARIWHTITADITDPIASMVLAYETVRGAEVTAAGESVVKLSAFYQPMTPPLLVGPCSVVACWGGTAAVTAIATLKWAEVPASRFAQ